MSLSSTPMHAASAISGIDSMVAVTDSGWTFSPPTMIIESERGVARKSWTRSGAT